MQTNSRCHPIATPSTPVAAASVRSGPRRGVSEGQVRRSIVRHAAEGDVPEVVALSRQFHAESLYRNIPFDAEWFATVMHRYAAEESKALFMVAADADGVYGYITAHVQPLQFSRRLAVLQDLLYVRPDRRGGIAGARLFRNFVDWAATHDPVFVEFAVSTGIAEHTSARLAARFGFEKQGMVFRRGL